MNTLSSTRTSSMSIWTCQLHFHKEADFSVVIDFLFLVQHFLAGACLFAVTVHQSYFVWQDFQRLSRVQQI